MKNKAQSMSVGLNPDYYLALQQIHGDIPIETIINVTMRDFLLSLAEDGNQCARKAVNGSPAQVITHDRLHNTLVLM